jgi:hypothetical protein
VPTCPPRPGRPPRLPDKEIFEYIRLYSSIFIYIQVYLSIFTVFLKNIQNFFPVCPIRARRNGQDCPPISLRTPSMTTLTAVGACLVILDDEERNLAEHEDVV